VREKTSEPRAGERGEPLNEVSPLNELSAMRMLLTQQQRSEET
jgi:hypothetical protein